MTLSPKYWAGMPSDDRGQAPYSAVLTCDPSRSSKLASLSSMTVQEDMR